MGQHFGHAAAFALVDVDRAAKTILSSLEVAAPEHQPGLLPRWLAERGVQVVIAGGMGERARMLLQAASIEVLTGVAADTVEGLVGHYLAGTLETGPSACEHRCQG